MAEKIDCGWLVGYDDKKFLPKTITSQILNSQGTYLFPNNGKDDNVGNSIRIMYIDHGVLTESTANIGSGSKDISGHTPVPVYLANGQITAMTISAGDANSPVYLNAGALTTVGTIAADHGGTGVNSHTANRLVWSKSATQLQAANHYASATKLAINSENEPNDNLYVNGTARIEGLTTHNGNIYFPSSGYIYSDGSISIRAGSGATPDTGQYGQLLITHNLLKLTSMSLYFNESYEGIYFKTWYENKNYPVLYQNNGVLCIGGQTDIYDAEGFPGHSGHHHGKTYISSGYDFSNSKGYDSIYVLIPPEGDNQGGGTTYPILHTGNYSTHLDDRYVNASGDTMTGNLSIKKESPVFRLYATDTPFQRGTSAPTENQSLYFMYLNDEDGSNLIASHYAYNSNSACYLHIAVAQASNADFVATYLRWGWDSNGKRYMASNAVNGAFSDMDATFNTVKGAVWNDYAEYREVKEELIPGKVVVETGLGDLVLATERLQPGANIISDTFGFSIGETEKSKTPIAVSGRVLAYPYENRNSYNPGDAVCTGPNGTVSKMTREEIIQYPERIVGTVSEIPEYDTWGEDNILVNNRIWIKVK